MSNPSDEKTPMTDESALCLSGGGIRSATFSLGVLQGLAKAGWLGQFTYLSTVSGGGYIGSWLTSWIYHADKERKNIKAGVDGVDAVCRQLKDSVTKGKSEPDEIFRLRAYSNYLSPRNGFSADFLTLIATFIRNMLLNWLVILPVIAGVVLVPMCVLALMANATRGLFGPLLLAAVACGICALAYATSDVPKKAEHQTINSRFRRYWLAPMFLSCVLVAAAALPVLGSHPFTLVPGDVEVPRLVCAQTLYVAAAGGLIIHVFGLLIGVWVRGKRKIHGRADDSTDAFKAQFNRGWSGIQWRGLGFAAFSGAVGGVLIWSMLWLFETYITGELRALVFVTLSVPTFLVCFQLGTALYVAFLSKDDDDGVREWWGRAGGYAIMAALAWISGFVVVVWLPALLVQMNWNLTGIGSAGGAGGLLALLGGFFGKNSAHPISGSAKSLWSRIADNGLVVGAGLFILALLVFSSIGWTWLVKAWLLETSHPGTIDSAAQYVAVLTSTWWVWGAALAASIVWVSVASLFIGSNTFSMQSLYGNRLTRAYLGSTRPKDTRHPHAFTKFDPDDDIALVESSPRRVNRPRLRHVINVALNISRPTEEQLAWQQRKAAPFTFTAELCGSPALARNPSSGNPVNGYVATARYAESSLGMAMSLSGAAASPNMGYHTSPLVAFVLTFFNVRLGAWLPNPARSLSNPQEMGQREPRTALYPLLFELLGRSTTEKPFVYLSDGGHFENLGLYEMVRRKCKRIVVVDASCDWEYEFEDLEASLRRIHTDLGARIEFPEGLPTPEYCARTGEHFVVGRIDYGDEDKFGELIYVKPVLGGDEPVDVTQYAVRSRRLGGKFPHDPTSDQFFDESQFESYRSLGYHSIGRNFPSWDENVYDERHPQLTADEQRMAKEAAVAARKEQDRRLAEMPAWLKELLFGAAGDATRTATGMGVPTMLALLGLPVTGAGAWWLSNQSETLIAVVPPAADAPALNVALFDQLVIRQEQDRRIMLPVFSEACSRDNRVAECTSRSFARDPDPATVGLLKRISHVLVTRCAVHSPVHVSIRGYSSSSEFGDADSPQKNVELADERAWSILNVLKSADQLGEAQHSKVTYEFTPRFCKASHAYAALCKQADSSEKPDNTRSRVDVAYQELKTERIRDRGEQAAPASGESQGPYYAGTGQMNRRVDLVFDEPGDCTLRDIWMAIQHKEDELQSLARLNP